MADNEVAPEREDAPEHADPNAHWITYIDHDGKTVRLPVSEYRPTDDVKYGRL